MSSVYNEYFNDLEPQPSPIRCLSPHDVTVSGLCHTILSVPPQGNSNTTWCNFHKTSFLKDISLDKYDLHVRLHDPRTLQCVFTSKETKGTLWKIAKNIQYAAVKVLFYLGGCFTTYISNLVKVLRYETSIGKEAKVLYQKLTGSYLACGYMAEHLDDIKTAKKIADFMTKGPQTREFIRCRIISGQLRALGLSMVNGSIGDYVELNISENDFREVSNEYAATATPFRNYETNLTPPLWVKENEK